MAMIFQACRKQGTPAEAENAPAETFLHHKYLKHLISGLTPTLMRIIEQGIDNTLVPSTPDEISETIRALIALLEKGTENPVGSLNFLSAL